MSSSTLPFRDLQQVHDSCRRVVTIVDAENAAAAPAAPHHVTVNRQAIREWVASIAQQSIEPPPKHLFPLKFATQESEVNLLTLHALLQFGSGYRVPLHTLCGRGAAETVLFGCIGMHISGEITTERLCALTLTEVASLFDIKTQEEFELQPGIHSERRTAVYPFAERMFDVLSRAGAALRALGFSSFAEFILHAPKVVEVESSATDASPTASALIQRLICHFPAFDDHYSLSPSVSDQPVYILKKAQLLAWHLYNRFHEEDARFRYADVEQLSIFADNVIPTVLRQLRILRFSDVLASLVDAGKAISEPLLQCQLRAGAIVACDEIMQEARRSQAAASGSSSQSLSGPILDQHFWRLGKEAAYRSLLRPVITDTVFF